MQVEVWLAFSFTVAAIVATGLVTWWGTKRTIENVAEVVARNIGGAVRAIHEDIRASQAKIESKLKGRKD